MKLYNTSKPLYLETDTAGISLGAGHLQVRDGMNCGWGKVLDNTALCPIASTSKSLSTAQQWYSNIEWKALGILHSLEKFHHCCFTKAVNIITGQKPLVAIINYQPQCIMLWIHQYSMYILYRPGPDLYIAHWLSYHNHTKNRDHKIAGMKISIHTLSVTMDISACT